jgi:photosystem II stability/assembly factor-like uncharacterized protein
VFTSPENGVLIRRVYLNSEDVFDVFTFYPNFSHRVPLPVAQYLYYTHDGGKTWIPKSSPVKIGTIYFSEANTGWLLGKNDADPSTPAQLYHTTNNGETWSLISAESILPLGSELHFVDNQTGFAFFPIQKSEFYRDFDNHVLEAMQQAYLFYTFDGGLTWSIVEPQIAPYIYKA